MHGLKQLPYLTSISNPIEMIFTEEFWTLAISLTGGLQCVLLSLSFLLLKKGNLFSHRLFAALMFLVGLRLFKSAWYVYAGDQMPLFWINIGFAAHLAAGPLLVQYVRTTIHAKAYSWTWHLHFLPSLIILLGMYSWSLDGFWYRGGYHLLLISSMAYWLYALVLLQPFSQQKALFSTAEKRWFYSLLFMMGSFFLVYAANYFWGLLPYSKAPIIYALALFPLSISAWRSYDLLTLSKQQIPVQKYQNIEIPTKTIALYKQKIVDYIQVEQPYLQGGYTIKQFSEALNIPSHLISWILSQHLHTNFTSLLNQHRVDYACQLLDDRKYDHYSIAGIAFEAGFNSLSVFNQNFKRRKEITPSAYRKRASS